MDCDRVGDERLQGDKMDVLYGEADAEVRARLDAHLAGCPACRAELAGLDRLREELAAWQLPRARPVATPRGFVLPRWLAAAAALLLGLSLPLGATAYLSLQRSLAAQRARADALEQNHRRLELALQGALGRAQPADERVLQALVERRVAEQVRASEARQAQRVDARFAQWSSRTDAQRRVDLARVAEGLSYLDGRHGQQLARTNELMSYVLDASQRR